MSTGLETLLKPPETSISDYKSTFDGRQTCLDQDEYKPLLPLVPNKGMTISCNMIFQILTGQNEFPIYDKIIILDARFAYEYSGGHIKGAYNVIDFESFLKLFKPRIKELQGKRTCIVVHCEYSSKRGPDLISKIRAWDRFNNMYPNVFFPELYLLDGGYRQFFLNHPCLCEPQTYVEMNDPLFESQYRMQKRKQNKTLPRAKSFSLYNVQSELLSPNYRLTKSLNVLPTSNSNFSFFNTRENAISDVASPFCKKPFSNINDENTSSDCDCATTDTELSDTNSQTSSSDCEGAQSISLPCELAFRIEF